MSQERDGLSKTTPVAAAAQLDRDVLAIEQARDALLTSEPAAAGRTSIALVLRRTADSVPVILGSVLGLMMVVVFSTAAVFVKLAR